MFLPGESQGWGSLMGCRLWGRTELDTTEATQQQQTIVNQSPLSMGILHARILEWVAYALLHRIFLTQGSNLRFYVSCIGRQVLYH